MYKISKEVSWQEIDDYLYINNEKTGEIYRLFGKGARIWKQIFDNQLDLKAEQKS